MNKSVRTVWFKVIVVILINAFLCLDIAWAAGGDLKRIFPLIFPIKSLNTHLAPSLALEKSTERDSLVRVYGGGKGWYNMAVRTTETGGHTEAANQDKPAATGNILTSYIIAKNTFVVFAVGGIAIILALIFSGCVFSDLANWLDKNIQKGLIEFVFMVSFFFDIFAIIGLLANFRQGFDTSSWYYSERKSLIKQKTDVTNRLRGLIKINETAERSMDWPYETEFDPIITREFRTLKDISERLRGFIPHVLDRVKILGRDITKEKIEGKILQLRIDTNSRIRPKDDGTHELIYPNDQRMTAIVRSIKEHLRYNPRGIVINGHLGRPQEQIQQVIRETIRDNPNCSREMIALLAKLIIAERKRDPETLEQVLDNSAYYRSILPKAIRGELNGAGYTVIKEKMKEDIEQIVAGRELDTIYDRIEEELQRALGREIKIQRAPDSIGSDVQAQIDGLQNEAILGLPNVRFHEEEEIFAVGVMLEELLTSLDNVGYVRNDTILEFEDRVKHLYDRSRLFFALDELSAIVRKLIGDVNEEEFSGIVDDTSRLFEALVNNQYITEQGGILDRFGRVRIFSDMQIEGYTDEQKEKIFKILQNCLKRNIIQKLQQEETQKRLREINNVIKEKEEAFRKEFFAGAEVSIMDAPGPLLRNHVSIVGPPQKSNTEHGLGILVADELRSVGNARENLQVMIFGGGNDLIEKLILVEGIVKNTLQPGGMLVLGSSAETAFVLERAGPDNRRKICINNTDEEIEEIIKIVKRIENIAKAKKITIRHPIVIKASKRSSAEILSLLRTIGIEEVEVVRKEEFSEIAADIGEDTDRLFNHLIQYGYITQIRNEYGLITDKFKGLKDHAGMEIDFLYADKKQEIYNILNRVKLRASDGWRVSQGQGDYALDLMDDEINRIIIDIRKVLNGNPKGLIVMHGTVGVTVQPLLTGTEKLLMGLAEISEEGTPVVVSGASTTEVARRLGIELGPNSRITPSGISNLRVLGANDELDVLALRSAARSDKKIEEAEQRIVNEKKWQARRTIGFLMMFLAFSVGVYILGIGIMNFIETHKNLTVIIGMLFFAIPMGTWFSHRKYHGSLRYAFEPYLSEQDSSRTSDHSSNSAPFRINDGTKSSQTRRLGHIDENDGAHDMGAKETPVISPPAITQRELVELRAIEMAI
ncbi:MAG: phosphoglycerate kinase [Candidatus Omnitrophota bacterium]